MDLVRTFLSLDLDIFSKFKELEFTDYSCPRTGLSILTQWVSTMEAHYPKFLKEIVIINAPGISQIAINVLRPFMSSETKETMKVFNNYRKTWMDYLDERVERDQRNERYGGTRWL